MPHCSSFSSKFLSTIKGNEEISLPNFLLTCFIYAIYVLRRLSLPLNSLHDFFKISAR